MRIVLVVLLAMIALPASAQSIYKCRDHKGNPLYQSFPCGGTKPPEKTWSGEYRRPTTPELWDRYNRDQAWRLRQQRIEQARAASAYSIGGGSQMQGMSKRASCSVVRSEYNRVQADSNLNRNIELLRNLESQIRNYCEVRP